ncbi:hypothetical protein SAMN05216571_101374 [Onishia taeanensis]|uniref:Uncharacterized protein n=1 Tax=Onishia taeanensis TaxID=284577 RepID=A0A1G7NDN7_9GAMM|nr:hypothetical protein [Halomonas taeanensis]SDF72017.1 hypothetical protein SAMN05216571_101374 [Halomonas taeanensis]
MKTELQILKHHRLSDDLQLLISRIHLQAMALNMQGNHQAIVQYRASIHTHGGHELSVDTKKPNECWTEGWGVRQAIALPGAASSPEQRLASLRQLGEAVNALSNLLEGGKPA